MVKLSPEELQAARKQVAEERALEQNRATQRNIWLTEAKQRRDQIKSVVGALYEEVDKLSRKWPMMPITQLTLEKTNQVIVAVRDLLKNETDDFVEAISEIIPAGDLPETRDAVLILGQLQAALRRFERKYEDEWLKHNGY